MALAQLVPLASAHPSIGLTTDVSHIILSPGEATNLTLTIHNNGSSIETYSVMVSGYDSAWEIIPADSNVSNVIPTYSASSTIAVRLSINALPSNSSSLTITVTEPDANISTNITVLLSVQPQYLPAIDSSTAGDNGLVNMAPGDDLNLSISVTNNGNVNDTLLLSVDQSPDLVGFWTNWTSGGGSNNTNNSGNTTGGNNTGGNNTGGNNTGGNNTGGNNTGNNTNGSLMMSGPQGWEVRFLDDTMDLMTPGEQRNAILRISIPANENPGYYGFDLFAASALGNFSVSSTLVVNVTAVHDLIFSYLPSGVILQPGENSTVGLNITSLSTADGNWTWEISVLVDQSQTGGLVQANCQAVLPNYSTFIIAGGIVSIDVNISTYANTHAGDWCSLVLSGTLDSDTSITESIEFTLVVGQQWNLSMVLPTSIKLDVGESESFNVAISNDGSEEDTISLIGIDKEGITFTNPSPVTLARGVSQYVVMVVEIDSSLVGNITLDFTMSSTNSGVGSVNQSGLFEVKAFSELSMEGPADSRIVVVPGQNSSIILNITNDGTRDLDLSASISGLPSGISVSSGLESISLGAGNSTDVELELVASAGVQPSSETFTITFDGGWTTTELTIDLQIADRHEVMIDTNQDRIIASPLGGANLTLMITNLGTSTETFVANINNSQVSDWFTVSVDKLSVNLAAGQSGSIIISAREIAGGAPASGNELVITVTSTDDSTVRDMLVIDIVPQIANGLITVMSDDDKAAPGGMINGNVIITNLGTATDSMLINTVEMDCNLDGEMLELAPSMSSNPIPWSCIIDENENAGVKVLTFRLTSTARSDMVLTTSESYTVEPIWSDEVISFTFEDNDLVFDESIEQQTISLTICNEANTYVEGNLELIGKNEPQMDGIFYRSGETGMNSTYSLSSKGCQDFRLMLTPLYMDGFEAVLVIHSVSQVEGQTVRDESEDLRASVAGPHLPPDGLNLGLLELNNKNSLILLSTGWIMSLLLLAYIRLFRKTTVIEEEEEEIPLGPNEVRIDEYNKVTCCSCEARLGIPEDSETPFRFTCPKCETRIRVVE